MDLTYTGKWVLTVSGGAPVSADAGSGLLGATASAPSGQTRFNAYGTRAKFVLQAAGGKYTAWSAGGYYSTLSRDGELTRFALQDAGGGRFRVADLGITGGDTPRYWQITGSSLARTQDQGSATAFAWQEITPGLAAIKEGNLPNPPADLRWIYFGAEDLRGASTLGEADLTGVVLTGGDLSDVTMTQTVLTGADLSKARLRGTDFTNATLDGTTLADADLTNAVFWQAHGTGTDLSRASMHGADLTQATLTRATLVSADLASAKPATILTSTDLDGADLSGADFTGATVNRVRLTGANLTGVKLSNPPPPADGTIDLSEATLDAKTNLYSAQLRYLNLSKHDLSNVKLTRADLTGTKLDDTTLACAELSFTNLTRVSLTGGVALSGANLSNAVLTGANLAGAQMGAIGMKFRVASDQSSYKTFLDALKKSDPDTVKSVFADNRVTLTGPVTVLASQWAGDRVWTINDSSHTYTVRLEVTSARTSLAAYEPVVATTLTNAYMKDVNLTGANLFKVRASGVQCFGTKALLDDQTILEGAQFDSANLNRVDLKGAQLQGVNFDHASLVATKFDGATLSVDAQGGQASFANANLQGASFIDARLDTAIFTDAAVVVTCDENSDDVDGVWLFSAAPAPVTDQLTAATRQFTLDSSLAGELRQGAVSSAVREAFSTAGGVQLGTGALVAVALTGPLWTVVDGATTYLVFHACDTDTYTPALGVHHGRTGFDVTFTIPLKLQGDLVSGKVRDSVRDAFHTGGGGQYDLGADAQVTAATMPTDWQIVDATAGYDLWLGIDPDCELTITVRPGMPAVRELFSGHSLPLSRRATVTGSGHGRWKVDNDSDNPFNATTNYIKFLLATEDSPKALAVYGQMLRVLQVGPDGTQSYTNLAMHPTALVRKDLCEDTICPNSNRKKVNEDDKIPFKNWMRAKELPKPPWCVPSADGQYYCPPADAEQRALSETEPNR